MNKKILLALLLLLSAIIVSARAEYDLTDWDESDKNQKFYGYQMDGYQLEGSEYWKIVEITTTTKRSVKGIGIENYYTAWEVRKSTATIYYDTFKGKKHLYTTPNGI